MNHTEEKLEDLAKALVVGREKFVWAVDRDMRLLYFNSLFIKEFEYAYGVKPKQWESIFVAAPDNVRKKWEARYARVLETGETMTFVYGQMAAGGEEIRYYEVVLAPLRRGGAVAAVVCEGSDSTEINWYKEVFRHTPDIVYCGRGRHTGHTLAGKPEGGIAGKCCFKEEKRDPGSRPDDL